MKFVNDETLNEFVVTVECKNVEVCDRDNDRDKALENNDLKNLSQQGNDRDDRVNQAGVPYKDLDGTQKNIIQFCSVPRSAREILIARGTAFVGSDATMKRLLAAAVA
jgi:hypothetical protein